MIKLFLRKSLLFALVVLELSRALLVETPSRHTVRRIADAASALSAVSNNDEEANRLAFTRRSLFQSVATYSGTLAWTATPAFAAAQRRQALPELLYRILRVREATQQETRLIKTGKFKDVQRANVKLAVKFMIDNYRLNDAFVGAAAYLDSSRQQKASQVGQTVVQSLYTILEYFDSSDVENIKVGSSSISGKEELVIKGLDSAKRGVDDFLAYFPVDQVDSVRRRIKEENDLNEKEFDPSLGKIVNLPDS